MHDDVPSNPGPNECESGSFMGFHNPHEGNIEKHS